MGKQVRLVVGEGDDKTEVGVARLEKISKDNSLITMTITNSALIQALGGETVQGILANFVESEEKTDE